MKGEREISYLADWAIRKGKEHGVSAISYLTSPEYKSEDYEDFIYHKKAYKQFINQYNGLFVYFLLKDNKIVYIGKTVCLYRRLMVHKSTNKYDFDAITYFDYSDYNISIEDLKVLENFFINENKSMIKNKHIPKLNKKLICEVLSKVENVIPVTISKEDINLL